MIYSYKCEGENCELTHSYTASMKDGPVEWIPCLCGRRMFRDWQADAPMIDTSGCKDHSEVRSDKRVFSAWDRGSPEHMEQQFKRQVESRRREISDAGGQRGSIKQTHSVPTHLFHGKIKETGDKNYWSDPKNLNRHKECKVDDN